MTRAGYGQPSFFIKRFGPGHTGNAGTLAAPSVRHPAGRCDIPELMPDRAGACGVVPGR